jgi:GWxTD domain-containing protein
MKIRFLLLLLLAAGLNGPGLAQDVRQEESEDYFRKWLEEDVRYIITDEEREIFRKLTTPEERENFIEQFWYRRDPDPRTAQNEFKEEHYRRIAYANERFGSGVAGWRTDRGRIYIIHGPPTEIIAYPSGGQYQRKPHEGGGSTAVYPFEIWRYRYLEGIGSDVELEFVDPTWAGQYRLTMDPDEKDALMRVPGAGLTLAEQLGRADKSQRPFFQPGMRERYPQMYLRSIDSPFARYERLAQVQSAQPLKYADLKQVVEVDISFNQLAFQVREDYFSLSSTQVLVPVTLEIENRQLSFEDKDGLKRARLAVYGVVTSITNRIVNEFDEDLVLTYRPEEMGPVLTSRSAYQRVLLLERGPRYRLDLVVKDLVSGSVGVVRRGIAPPADQPDQLQASSVILSDLIVPLDSAPIDQMFVLGDVKVRPRVGNAFSSADAIGVYLQLYGLELDQATQSPSLETQYRIRRGDRAVLEVTGGSLEGVRLYNDRRAALVKILPIRDLEPGNYQLDLTVKDLVGKKSVSRTERFEILAAGQASMGSGGR